jgi:hypothetical protein
MASELQSKYIADLAVLKTKEFKEVKEMLLASDIVGKPGENPELINNAETIADITHSLTDLQASKFIDLLIQTKEPARGKVYSEKRITRATGDLDHIKAIINGWGFEE